MRAGEVQRRMRSLPFSFVVGAASLAFLASSTVHAKIDLYLHSGVRTAPAGREANAALNRGALDGIAKRLPAHRGVKEVRFKKAGSDAATIWTPGKKFDGFAVAGPSTLQCLAALFKRTLTPRSEQRIACRFFEPQTFLVVIFDDKGTLSIEEAPLKSVDPPVGPTASSLKKKYGVHDFQNGDARWTAQEFAIVDEALSMLTKRELAIVGDVPFVRERRSREKRSAAPGNVAGFYLPGEGRFASKIFIYDAFTTNDGIIMGTAERQIGPGTMALVHELGHALASAAFRKKQNLKNAAMDQKRTLKSDRDRAYDTYKSAEANYNAIKGDRSRSQAEKNRVIEDLNAKIHKFNALDNAYKKLINQENALIRRQQKTGKPAEVELSKLLPTPKAVTLYGRTTPGEAFAEAYMLFKIDPAALKRISAEAYAYFESERYLDVIEADIQKRLSQ